MKYYNEKSPIWRKKWRKNGKKKSKRSPEFVLRLIFTFCVTLQARLEEKFSVPSEDSFVAELHKNLGYRYCFWFIPPKCSPCTCVFACSEEADLNTQDPFTFSKLLDQTKSHGRMLGKIGDAAKTIISEKRELSLLSSAGKKASALVLALPSDFQFHCDV